MRFAYFLSNGVLLTTLKHSTIALTGFVLMGALAGCNKDAAAKESATPAQSKTADSALSATPAQNDKALVVELQQNLDRAGVHAQVQSVVPTQMPDFYLASIANMPPVFIDKTATYLLQGDLIKLDTKPINLSQQAQSIVAKQALQSVDRSEMIVFPAKGTQKAAVYVFSDPTCHYCQLLHKDIDKLNAKGLEVRYLAWPRSEDVVPLTEAIWCSADRNKALTDAKMGKMPNPVVCDNPVQKHIALGHSLGVSGTPAVFTENGEQIGGYLPPNDLVKAAQINP